MFGTELANQVEYKFSGKKLAIYTWQGCTLSIQGQFLVEYIGRETTMNSFLNVHMALDQIRKSNDLSASLGPRVLILGQSDCGKTTLAKTLASYAGKLAVAKQGKPLMLVDLDSNEVVQVNLGNHFFTRHLVSHGRDSPIGC